MEIRKFLFDKWEFMLSNDFVYTSNFEVIAKHFVREYFNIEDAFKLSDEEFKKCVLAKEPLFFCYNKDDIYKSVCMYYLKLEKEPRIKYDEYLREYRLNLKEAIENINYCKEEIKNEQNKLEQNKYYINKMEYFINLNEDYINNLNNFFIYDMRKMVIKECQIKEKMINLFGVTNSYPQIFMHFYKHSPQKSNNVEVKFGNLPLQQYHEIQKIYREDINLYYNIMSNYIKEANLIEELKNEINSNYLLKQRKEILLEAINFYNNKQKQVFVNIAAIQFEGLFNDYCEFQKIDLTNKRHTLVGKIDLINSKDYFWGYVYFRFDFPEIRNKIAHGNLIESEELDKLSDELLLDLNFVIGLFKKEDLFFNQVINYLKDYEGKETYEEESNFFINMVINDENFFCDFIESNCMEMLKYYKLELKFNELIKVLTKQDFWNFFLDRDRLEELVFTQTNGINILNKKEIQKVIKKIMNICIKNDKYKKLCIEANKAATKQNSESE
ncbi:hypothetical protein [Clostridium butyricum]|uniref:hypothetical protein n=1 Tax=Clostridium butyricum TaxID=1492 RepID=UPI00129C0FDC|nr:hypothetical protein [Clostridium butyricum]QGH20249.1 hypothetical protein EBL75_01065 [Clostridium butyricum]QGH24284.1 hypothetical protein EBQ27_01065 [Clostridium butyricum]